MSFVSVPSRTSGAAPTLGQLYQYGTAQQKQFQCGWKTGYLKAAPAAKQPMSFATFGSTAFNTQLQSVKQQQQQQSVKQPIRQLVPSAPQPSQLASASQYYMAGRQGCGFVRKAVEQHQLQKRVVTELDCMGDDAEHPVCQIQRQYRRGTPMYYKQTGDTYELVQKGYSQDVSFLPAAAE